MNYEYVLTTFNLKGQLIDREVIAYTRVDEGRVYRAVATISSELEIVIAEGHSYDGNDLFDPASSRTREMEILASGEIV